MLKKLWQWLTSKWQEEKLNRKLSSIWDYSGAVRVEDITKLIGDIKLSETPFITGITQACSHPVRVYYRRYRRGHNRCWSCGAKTSMPRKINVYESEFGSVNETQ